MGVFSAPPLLPIPAAARVRRPAGRAAHRGRRRPYRLRRAPSPHHGGTRYTAPSPFPALSMDARHVLYPRQEPEPHAGTLYIKGHLFPPAASPPSQPHPPAGAMVNTEHRGNAASCQRLRLWRLGVRFPRPQCNGPKMLPSLLRCFPKVERCTLKCASDWNMCTTGTNS